MSNQQRSYFRIISACILFFIFSTFQLINNAYANRLLPPESATENIIEFTSETAGRTAHVISDELLIRYKPRVTFQKKDRVRRVYGLEYKPSKRDSLKKEGIEHVRILPLAAKKVVDEKDLRAVMKQLKEDPSIEYAEPNYIAEIQTIEPNDTDYTKQWSPIQINVPAFWETTTGNEQVKVAVLDTGLDFNHIDKPQHLLPGYDFVNDDSDPTDDHGHGTYIAGVIAAHSDNANGITGLCWNCSILPVKVMNQHGKGTYGDTANGIIWAADQGVDIVNLSVGGYEYSQALQDAVSYAQEHGVLVVAAGGNHGIHVPMYPANYSDVIGVSATDSNNELWSGSNTGEHIDLAAPGVNVYGLGLHNTYSSRNGSSVATAHVSGIAALLLSDNPSLNNNQIKQKLYENTEDLGEIGKDESFGFGLVKLKTDEINEKPTEGNSIRDLALINITIDPPVFKTGEQSSIIVNVQNQGEAEEENLEVQIFVNNELLSQKNIQQLKSQQSQSIEFEWQPNIQEGQQANLVIRAEVSIVENELEVDDNILVNDLLAKNENGVITIQYSKDVHRWLTEQGIYYLEKANNQAFAEVKNYIPQMRQGAYEEDAIGYNGIQCKIFESLYLNVIDTPWRPLRHFYRPTDEKGYFDNASISANNVWCAKKVIPNQVYPNAYEWASGQITENHHDFQGSGVFFLE